MGIPVDGATDSARRSGPSLDAGYAAMNRPPDQAVDRRRSVGPKAGGLDRLDATATRPDDETADATIADKHITATFHVPKPPLVLDTERVTNPGSFGFEVVDAAATRLDIADVAISAPDTVTVTLASAPAGPVRLRYAYTGTPFTCPGKTAGPRGNLRDSDDTPSLHGYELFNWGVHFDVPVN